MTEKAASPSRLGRRLIVGVVFGLVVYAGIILWADLDAILAALEDFPLAVFPAAMGLSFANYVVRFARWERYRALLDIRMGRGTSFLIYLSGLCLTVSPGKMGEVFKSWLIKKIDGTPVHESAPMVIAERFTDLLGFLVLVAIGGIATQPEYAWIFWATLGVCAVLLCVAGSARFARLATRMCAKLPLLWRIAPKIEASFANARVLLAPRELLMPTFVATLGWGLECVGFWLVANAMLGSEVIGDVSAGTNPVPLSFAVYTFALSSIAGAVLILFPGGLGVTEATLGGLLIQRYKAIGLAGELARSKAASAVILIRLATLWFAVGVGVVATAIFRARHGPLEEPAEE